MHADSYDKSSQQGVFHLQNIVILLLNKVVHNWVIDSSAAATGKCMKFEEEDTHTKKRSFSIGILGALKSS